VSYAIGVLFKSQENPMRRRKLDSILDGDAEEKRMAREEMLRDWEAMRAALPNVDAEFIRETRGKLGCSRAVFARRLCMNERTLEKWEQGRAKPNAQAAVLLLLVWHFPDTLERLRRIAIPDPIKRRSTSL
jgi:putative transcriptional regulator